MKSAGLTRVHTGLMNGSAEVLNRMGKGACPGEQIAGWKTFTWCLFVWTWLEISPGISVGAPAAAIAILAGKWL